MSLRLRHVYLRVETPNGLYGTSLGFPDGLVVLRADNSSGKSTLVQSIIYALGLEGMLSATHDVPLPHVMTDSVKDDTTEIEYEVTRSFVAVEVENAQGQRVTIWRTVKGNRDRRLITVVFGPSLTGPSADYPKRDFYVRVPFAAQSEAGFHHWFADWIGWELPAVGRFDGSEGPLYVECMFPFMIVEQKRGWSNIPARLPVHYRIRDVGKRATEFLLALDVYDTTHRRQRLKEQADDLRSRWRNRVDKVDGVIAPVNGVVQRLPKEPVSNWPLIAPPAPVVSRDTIWVSLSDARIRDRLRLDELEKREIPRVRQISEDASKSLLDSEADLAETDFVINQLFDEIQLERNQIENLRRRIAAIDEDIRRNKDVRQLRKMGSQSNLDMDDATCPTCHQAITDTLLPVDARHQPMTVDDNILYLESQRSTFDTALATSTNTLVARERRMSALRSHADAARSRIRSLKETLVADGQEPSVAAIEERIKLRESVRLLTKIENEVADHLEQFSMLAAEWKLLQQQIADLPKGDLSADDEAKLDELQRHFVANAGVFGVTSLLPYSLMISRESYKPTHDGFELEFDLSASDMIRVIWSYLYSLLEISRDNRTNHLGLLIMDEPGQQQMKHLSLISLMRQAATSRNYSQQVILATSQDDHNVRPQLEDVPHTYINIQGLIIKKM